ncbi:MAG: peptidase M75 [Prevotellaceae bacterium]|jgi:hypothetical protein|nr:peptidase M75 [Prevotellaceae bacterium]
MRRISYIFVLLFTSIAFFSCEETVEDPFAEREKALTPAISQYVNQTVIVTYRNLAGASIDLYNAIAALKADKTQANLNTATEIWFASRKYWELSEAFLFGAASDFGIDPHIDTWPLDETAFNYEMANTGHIASMDSEDGDIWAADHLGPSLLGFHGIEYILFENGIQKNVSAITDAQLTYAKAVAGDLRNQCIRLEAAWAGIDNVSSPKRALIEEKELVVERSNSDFSYGENMINAGQSGSTCKTVAKAAVDILSGCIDISDEVGVTKIGTANSKENTDYIESPYSFNSLVDFVDNIKSIENAYLGGSDANNRGANISDFIKKNKPEVDNEVREAINNAIAKINAIPYPFVQNYDSPQATLAIDACNVLTKALQKAKAVLEE